MKTQNFQEVYKICDQETVYTPVVYKRRWDIEQKSLRTEKWYFSKIKTTPS